jgi:SNF2 family DNA or RNA helicase
VLTGARRPRRDEVLGGIVADDMGLGKSLVMLSTVAASLGPAKAFGDPGSFLDDPSRSAERINSQATLILAPSTCMINKWS